MQKTKNRTLRRCVCWVNRLQCAAPPGLYHQAVLGTPTEGYPRAGLTIWIPFLAFDLTPPILHSDKNVLCRFQFPSVVQRRTGSTWASSIKTKRARIDFILSVRWITVLILLDLFRHTFTIETLALRRQGGKTNNSNVQKRHRVYVTRFKCLANMLVGGWISMRSFHTRDPKTINSLLHQYFDHFFPPKESFHCWIKINDSHNLFNSWGCFHFQSHGFLVSINIFTD